jgi:hypothetical protein
MNGNSQQLAYSDPAQAYNKLLIEKQQNTYQRIGVYKVRGSLYLFGGNNEGKIYPAGDSGYNVTISYSSFSKEVSFTAAQLNGLTGTKKPGSVDSFVLKANTASGFASDLKFVYAPLVGLKEKTYLQQMISGPDYHLYKKYNSELEIIPDNYGPADLLQFNISVSYYYDDGSGKLSQFKPEPSFLRKLITESKKNDLSVNEDALMTNKDAELERIFARLND